MRRSSIANGFIILLIATGKESFNEDILAFRALRVQRK
jgi:hypothetical protein